LESARKAQQVGSTLLCSPAWKAQPPSAFCKLRKSEEQLARSRALLGADSAGEFSARFDSSDICKGCITKRD
jgi:hypothetical protein